MADKVLTVWTPIGDVNLTAALLTQILGGVGGQIIETALTTVGNGTLTAAAITGGQVARTGPTSAFTDTTDTAANIVTALGGFESGETFFFYYKNATTWPATIAAGSGVTAAAGSVVAPMSTGLYYATMGGTSASPTITFKHIGDVPIRVAPDLTNPQATALTTVGAGTLTAALMATGTIVRGGTQIAAFADTTDSVANIIAGLSPLGLAVGASQKLLYVNNTIFPATITGASSVTITGQAVVPANAWVEYIVTQTSASAITFTAIRSGYFPTSGTFVCNGVTPVTVANTALTANSNVVITLKTVGGTVGAIPHLATVTPGTGFTVVGTASDSSTYAYEIRG
ncbi:hypothetical protein [Bradyrhizobium sp.]